MSGVVTTQDVSFGACWVRLLGERARWEPGYDGVAPLDVAEDEPVFGAGLVAVWVEDDGPVLVCHPARGLRAIKDFSPGVAPRALRAALRAGNAVIREFGAKTEPPPA